MHEEPARACTVPGEDRPRVAGPQVGRCRDSAPSVAGSCLCSPLLRGSEDGQGRPTGALRLAWECRWEELLPVPAPSSAAPASVTAVGKDAVARRIPVQASWGRHGAYRAAAQTHPPPVGLHHYPEPERSNPETSPVTHSRLEETSLRTSRNRRELCTRCQKRPHPGHPRPGGCCLVPVPRHRVRVHTGSRTRQTAHSPASLCVGCDAAVTGGGMGWPVQACHGPMTARAGPGENTASPLP